MSRGFWAVAATLGLAIIASNGAMAVPAPGDHLNRFSLPSADGKLVEWKPGRTSVLSFCAFWCDTWKEQSTRLARCRKSLDRQPIDFITISVDGRWAERCDGKAVGKLLLDLKSALAHRLGINRIPYTLVVDSDGVIRYASEGIVREVAVTNAARQCAAGKPTADCGTIYLTFDDFPSSVNGESTVPAKDPDERLLDVLQANKIQATFFCVCSRLEQRRGTVERAYKKGYSLQIHSWDHNADAPQIDRCVHAIKALTGTDATLYRPPGRENLLRIRGPDNPPLPVIDPYDYTRPGRDEIKRRILLAVKPGCVVLLHAGVGETIDVLPEVISSMRKRGFIFGVLR